jgi:MFS family permease
MLREFPKRQKVVVMIAVMCALFLVALDQTIVSTALASIVREFKSFSSLGFIVTAYLLMTTITVPLAGKMSDMFGRRPVLITGVAIFTIGSFLSGISPSVEWLIAWRALQGVGGGIITSQAFTIVGDLFSPRERGRWQGFTGAVFGMASVIGPLLGGWLTDGQHLLRD